MPGARPGRRPEALRWLSPGSSGTSFASPRTSSRRKPGSTAPPERCGKVDPGFRRDDGKSGRRQPGRSLLRVLLADLAGQGLDLALQRLDLAAHRVELAFLAVARRRL